MSCFCGLWFNQLSLRQNAGALWENFCIAERMRNNANNGIGANYYFWRTYDQKEIDLIEERSGKFFAFEFKLQEQKIVSKKFLENYPNSIVSQVTRKNYWETLLK